MGRRRKLIQHMKNTEKSSNSDNITLSKKDLEKIKSDMFEAGYLAGAQKLGLNARKK